MELNDLLLKTASQLNDTERDFIRQNVDKLSDEDKDAYKDFLNPDEGTLPDDPGTPPDSEGIPPTSEGGTPAAPSQNDPGGGTGTKPPLTFQSEDEAKAFVQNAIAENEAAKKKAIAEAQTPEQKKWVEDNWKPLNWNEGISTIADVAVQIMEQRQAAKEQQRNAAQQRAKKDWDDLRTKYNLPDVTTKKGLTIHNQIVDMGLKHGKRNFQEAYDLWSVIPVDKGGGYQIPTAENAPGEEVIDTPTGEVKPQQNAAKTQRQAASRVTGANSGGTVPQSGKLPPISYEDLKKGRNKIIKV